MQSELTASHCQVAIQCLASGGTLEGALAHVSPWHNAGAFLSDVASNRNDAHAIWLTLVAMRIDILRQKVDAIHDRLERVHLDNVALPREERLALARVASIEKEISQLAKQLELKQTKPTPPKQQETRAARTLMDRMIS